ncbi:MAG TPA: dihydrolipoyl dehydrogenase [Armatimonadaceae bacterium]|jgi:dihydrolipoamide dehydrogenase|nr:dihydrolipoyl dehydrogenase [Armatimonadaceae bacterium]
MATTAAAAAGGGAAPKAAANGRDFDVVVIGGGPGGYPCAIRAAQLGAKAACVEMDNPGGTCLNWGCIPTKTMIGSVSALHTLKHAKDFGLFAENVGYDFGAVMSRKDKVVKKLVGGVGYLFKKNGVTQIEGIGSIVDPNTVEVTKPDGSKQRYTTNNIVIATGSIPAKLPVEGLQEADVFTPNWDVKKKFAEGTLAGGKVWTSNEAVSAKQVPDELVVIGGGVIGCEFAYTYNGLGSKVTIVEFLPSIIATMDADIAAELQKQLTKQGITIKTGCGVTKVEEKDGKMLVYYSNGKTGEESVAQGDVVLVATGRSPFTDGLNLEGVGVTVGSPKGKRAIAVDDHMRTNVPGVWAIGDVVGSGLAHTATMEGIVCAENICGHEAVMSYKANPSCIYTEPECSAVGLTEQQARDKGYDVAIGTFTFRNLGKAMAINDTEGFVKVVAEKKYGEILGVHIIGPHATDLIPEAVVSIQLENTVEELMRTIHAHPTLAEAIGQANEDVRGLAIDKG